MGKLNFPLQPGPSVIVDFPDVSHYFSMQSQEVEWLTKHQSTSDWFTMAVVAFVRNSGESMCGFGNKENLHTRHIVNNVRPPEFACKWTPRGLFLFHTRFTWLSLKVFWLGLECNGIMKNGFLNSFCFFFFFRLCMLFPTGNSLFQNQNHHCIGVIMIGNVCEKKV